MSIDKRALFISVGKVEDELYASTLYDGILAKINLKNYNVEYVALRGDGIPEDFSFSGFYERRESTLYLLDKYGVILKYDLLNNSCHKIDTGMDIPTETDLSYTLAVMKNEKMIIFPKYGKKIIRVNIVTEETQNIEILPEYDYLFDETSVIPVPAFCCALKYDNKVYLITQNGKWLVEYNLNSDDIKKYKISDEDLDLANAVIKNGIIYVLDWYGRIYVLDHKCIKIKYDSMDGRRYQYGLLAVTEKSIWLLPSMGKDIKRVDINNGFENIYNDEKKNLVYNTIVDNQAKFMLFDEDEENYYYANPTTECMLKINKCSDEISWHKPIIINRQQKLKSVIGKTDIFQEGIFRLDDFLKSI